MKIKKFYLFLFTIICFCICFVVINNKYDKFYRITGINNENRILIETYLDDAEQEYLIQNNIAISEFITYIKYQGFSLFNYEYYQIIDSYKIYNKDVLVDKTNSVIDKLMEYSPRDVLSNLQLLCDSKMVDDYLNNNHFIFERISVYQKIKANYVDNDNYLEVVDGYIVALNKLGYLNESEYSEVLITLLNHYSIENINLLLEESLKREKTIFVLNPKDLTVITNDDNQIGNYIPSDLVLIEDVSRLSYFVYLQNEAYEALKAMCYDYDRSAIYQPYFVVKGYESFDSGNINIGTNEFQLGTTITMQVSGLSIEDFGESNFYKWLDENAYLYGFILRYPEGTDTITGKTPNSYTYRYVGKEVALEMKENNIKTLEEYRSFSVEE